MSDRADIIRIMAVRLALDTNRYRDLTDGVEDVVITLELAELRTQGTPIPTNDLWIAALVVEHGLTLYTRDRHFEHLPQLPLL